MKLLYLSCHEVHAYDEVLLLSELGVETFVLGSTPGKLRPKLDGLLNQRRDFLSSSEHVRVESMLLGEGRGLEKWFVDKFDAVLVLSRNDWLINFWDAVKHKKVIFRLNGQSDEGTESRLKPFTERGMEVLGFSPHENRKFTRLPVRRTIRLYKDPEEWCGWTGQENSVMTSCQAIERGGECCNPTAYRETLRDFPHVLYGGENEKFLNESRGRGSGMLFPQSGALLDYQTLKEKFREHRAYFYLGTQPASYTLNFIEAWMTGIPVVALGPRFHTHEVCELIENGVDGFYSDDIFQLKSYLRRLLDDAGFGRKIGEAGRKKAVVLFGKPVIQRQWREFLSRIL